MSRSNPSYVQILQLYKIFPSVETLEKVFSKFIRLIRLADKSYLVNFQLYLKLDVKLKHMFLILILFGITIGTNGIYVDRL